MAKWLREDARHHAAYVRVEEGWRQAECLKSLRPLDGTVRADLLDEVAGLAACGAGVHGAPLHCRTCRHPISHSLLRWAPAH